MFQFNFPPVIIISGQSATVADGTPPPLQHQSSLSDRRGISMPQLPGGVTSDYSSASDSQVSNSSSIDAGDVSREDGS